MNVGTHMFSRVQRLAFFVPNLEGGGAERIIVRLANEISARGYDVDLVVIERRGPFLKMVDPNVRLVSLGSKRARFALLRLRKYLLESQPVAMVSTLRTCILLSIVAGTWIRTGTKVIARQANYILPRTQWMERFVFRLLNPSFVYKRADHFIALSVDVAKNINDMFNIPMEKIEVIPNPAFPDLVPGQVGSERDSSGTSERQGRQRLIVMIGSLTKQKDYGTFLRAYRDVRNQVNAKVVILGEGPERERIVKQINSLGLEHDVELRGFVANPTHVLREADLFVHTARYEGFGNVIVEALSVGVPVVATDCPGGPNEILGAGRFGRLVPVGDSDALARAITLELSSEVSDYDVQLRKARAREYHINAIAERYLQVMLS